MIEQYSPEWFAARLGKATASRIADATARTKTGWGASRANYMAQLIAERLTGTPGESYTSAAMQWGIDHEADACAMYAFRADVELEPCGFIDHPTLAMSGASPDRYVGAEGLLEVKCPNTATHIDTLLSQSIDGKYLKQMQWQMVCCGRAWCDFISFDPRLPTEMQLFVKHVGRDDKMIAELQEQIAEFLTETDAKLEALASRYLKRISPTKAALAASLEATT